MDPENHWFVEQNNLWRPAPRRIRMSLDDGGLNGPHRGASSTVVGPPDLALKSGAAGSLPWRRKAQAKHQAIERWLD